MAAVDASNTGGSEPIARQPGQVGQPLAAAARDETRRRVACRRAGSTPKAARTSPPTSNRVGPMQAPSQAHISSGAQLRGGAHRGDGGLDDAAGEAAPAGVGGADRASPGRGEKHRQAVGGLDDAGDAGCRS